MGGVVPRGVTGSVLIAAGGFCYDRLPHGTWLDGAPVLWTVRHSAHNEAWGLALSVTGLLLLTWAWWDLRGDLRRDRAGLRRVHVATGAWAAPLLLAPPLFSGDGWSYVATGALTGRGLSPYLWTPAALPTPLRSGVAPHWLFTPSPYGPLSLAWGGLLARATGDPWTLLGWYRLLSVLSLALLAWAVPVVARLAGRDPADASGLVVASPFVLVHGIGGLHNDLTVAALVLAAVAVTRRGRWVLGALLVGVAAAVKAPGLLGAVGVVLVSLDPHASRVSRLLRSVVVGTTALVVLLAAGWLTGLGTGWVHALVVPEGEHTQLAITWVAGRWVRDLLVHAGPWGVAAVHHVHPAQLAKRIGLVLLVLTAASVTLVRRTGSPARALSGAGLVLLAAVVLSPAGHYWYFLWCVPLLACLPLHRRERAALVTGIVTLGLTAPADAALRKVWLMDWSALAVVLAPLVAWVVVAAQDRRTSRASAGRLDVT
jgi:alpha-1,6-mannosyltransferase